MLSLPHQYTTLCLQEEEATADVPAAARPLKSSKVSLSLKGYIDQPAICGKTAGDTESKNCLKLIRFIPRLKVLMLPR